MKKLTTNICNMVIVGTADEMKAVVKSVRRAYNRYATDWYTSHCSMPKFNPTKGYAIIFDEDDKAMYVKPIDIALVENVERG